jgi:caffeoyl-CoA O-methyltransferase
MTGKLEQYLHDYTSPEDPVLEELYRQTHLRFVNPNMSSGHLQGKLLEFISRMIRPNYILEIGTFTGYSGICLSKGLERGGKLVTIEINDELTTFAGSFFRKAGVESSIIQMTGDALEIIPALEYQFDLVFIDGDKREYTGYFNRVLEKLVPGGFILADNVLWGGKVLDEETGDPQTRGIIEFNRMIRNNESVDKVILPLRDGLALIRKL